MKPQHEDKMLTPPENKYTFSEPSFSKTPASKTHIRKKTNKQRLGADTPALCGAEVLWDLANPINEHQLRQKNVCERCLTEYRKVLRDG